MWTVLLSFAVLSGAAFGERPLVDLTSAEQEPLADQVLAKFDDLRCAKDAKFTFGQACLAIRWDIEQAKMTRRLYEQLHNTITLTPADLDDVRVQINDNLGSEILDTKMDTKQFKGLDVAMEKVMHGLMRSEPTDESLLRTVEQLVNSIRDTECRSVITHHDGIMLFSDLATKFNNFEDLRTGLTDHLKTLTSTSQQMRTVKDVVKNTINSAMLRLSGVILAGQELVTGNNARPAVVALLARMSTLEKNKAFRLTLDETRRDTTDMPIFTGNSYDPAVSSYYPGSPTFTSDTYDPAVSSNYPTSPTFTADNSDPSVSSYVPIVVRSSAHRHYHMDTAKPEVGEKRSEPRLSPDQVTCPVQRQTVANIVTLYLMNSVDQMMLRQILVEAFTTAGKTENAKTFLTCLCIADHLEPEKAALEKLITSQDLKRTSLPMLMSTLKKRLPKMELEFFYSQQFADMLDTIYTTISKDDTLCSLNPTTINDELLHVVSASKERYTRANFRELVMHTLDKNVDKNDIDKIVTATQANLRWYRERHNLKVELLIARIKADKPIWNVLQDQLSNLKEDVKQTTTNAWDIIKDKIHHAPFWFLKLNAHHHNLVRRELCQPQKLAVSNIVALYFIDSIDQILLRETLVKALVAEGKTVNAKTFLACLCFPNHLQPQTAVRKLVTSQALESTTLPELLSTLNNTLPKMRLAFFYSQEFANMLDTVHKYIAEDDTLCHLNPTAINHQLLDIISASKDRYSRANFRNLVMHTMDNAQKDDIDEIMTATQDDLNWYRERHGMTVHIILDSLKASQPIWDVLEYKLDDLDIYVPHAADNAWDVVKQKVHQAPMWFNLNPNPNFVRRQLCLPQKLAVSNMAAVATLNSLDNILIRAILLTITDSAGLSNSEFLNRVRQVAEKLNPEDELVNNLVKNNEMQDLRLFSALKTLRESMHQESLAQLMLHFKNRLNTMYKSLDDFNKIIASDTNTCSLNAEELEKALINILQSIKNRYTKTNFDRLLTSSLPSIVKTNIAKVRQAFDAQHAWYRKAHFEVVSHIIEELKAGNPITPVVEQVFAVVKNLMES